MIKNQDIICISSIDWDFIWQGHQEIMSTLAKNGNRVIFIENTGVRSPRIRDLPRIKNRVRNYFRGVKGIREERENLYIFSPVLLPFPYSRLARKINRFLLLSVLEKWMKALDFADPIIWTFLPTGLTLEVANNINKKLLIYYCIDNFSASSPYAKKVKPSEIKLLKAADLVFVTSQALFNYCARYNNSVHLFPFGVNIDNFKSAMTSGAAMPGEFKNIKGPIVGYIGGVHKWLDQGLIKKVALACPDFSFVFIGPLQTDVSELKAIKNVYFLGNKKHSELPYFVKYFSVAIIPYLVNEYTRNVYPTKLNEYLSMGKPVVATDLPEIGFFNQHYNSIVNIAQNSEAFRTCIINALSRDNDNLREKRREAAKDNSWENRIEEMSGLIASSIERKMRDREARWKESLKVFYRKARRRLFRIGIPLVSIYFIIFYTPLIWMIAAPLKISQTPQNADAIVVLAGGVGESGRAGQGYEERVEYASELYKRGYAKKLIFSSGYMFVFKEPIVMRALAVSLGVPEASITLEDKAANTYENVKFVTKILNDNKWNRILLVTSPYHMLRTSLVFKKNASEIKLICMPLIKSKFYSHEDTDNTGRRNWKTANLQQIRAILHEYLSIFYYLVKGYI